MLDDRTREAHKRVTVAIVRGALSPPDDIPVDVVERALSDYMLLVTSGLADQLRAFGWSFDDLRALGCFVMGRRIVAFGSEVVGFEDDRDDAIVRPSLWRSMTAELCGAMPRKPAFGIGIDWSVTTVN